MHFLHFYIFLIYDVSCQNINHWRLGLGLVNVFLDLGPPASFNDHCNMLGFMIFFSEWALIVFHRNESRAWKNSTVVPWETQLLDPTQKNIPGIWPKSSLFPGLTRGFLFVRHDSRAVCSGGERHSPSSEWLLPFNASGGHLQHLRETTVSRPVRSAETSVTPRPQWHRLHVKLFCCCAADWVRPPFTPGRVLEGPPEGILHLT